MASLSSSQLQKVGKTRWGTARRLGTPHPRFTPQNLFLQKWDSMDQSLGDFKLHPAFLHSQLQGWHWDLRPGLRWCGGTEFVTPPPPPGSCRPGQSSAQALKGAGRVDGGGSGRARAWEVGPSPWCLEASSSGLQPINKQEKQSTGKGSLWKLKTGHVFALRARETCRRGHNVCLVQADLQFDLMASHMVP